MCRVLTGTSLKWGCFYRRSRERWGPSHEQRGRWVCTTEQRQRGRTTTARPSTATDTPSAVPRGGEKVERKPRRRRRRQTGPCSRGMHEGQLHSFSFDLGMCEYLGRRRDEGRMGGGRPGLRRQACSRPKRHRAAPPRGTGRAGEGRQVGGPRSRQRVREGCVGSGLELCRLKAY